MLLLLLVGWRGLVLLLLLLLLEGHELLVVHGAGHQASRTSWGRTRRTPAVATPARDRTPRGRPAPTLGAGAASTGAPEVAGPCGTHHGATRVASSAAGSSLTKGILWPVGQVLLWPGVLHACCSSTHHAHVARLLRGSSHGVPCPPWVVALAKAWRGRAHHATARTWRGPSDAGRCAALHHGLWRWPATPIAPTIVLAHAPWWRQVMHASCLCLCSLLHAGVEHALLAHLLRCHALGAHLLLAHHHLVALLLLLLQHVHVWLGIRRCTAVSRSANWTLHGDWRSPLWTLRRALRRPTKKLRRRVTGSQHRAESGLGLGKLALEAGSWGKGLLGRIVRLLLHGRRLLSVPLLGRRGRSLGVHGLLLRGVGQGAPDRRGLPCKALGFARPPLGLGFLGTSTW